MENPLVVLVNEKDEVLGYAPKLEAHISGSLHRAISVLIFNSKGEWLLQKRASHKYHCSNLWSNTCCTHPYPNEKVKDAAERRLEEEMGISCNIEKIGTFIYKTKVDNNLYEHEFDHVFIGICDDFPILNPDEVGEWKYMKEEDLEADMKSNPKKYTEWFKIIFTKTTNEFTLPTFTKSKIA